VRYIFLPKFLSLCIFLSAVLFSLTSCIDTDTSLISIQDRTTIGTSLVLVDKQTQATIGNLTLVGNTEYLLQDNKNASLLSFLYVKRFKDKTFYLVQEERLRRSSLESTNEKFYKFRIMPLIIDDQNNLTMGAIQCNSTALLSSKKNNINLECRKTSFAEAIITGEPIHNSLDCFFYDLFEGNSIKWEESRAALTGYKIPKSTDDLQCPHR
jgi:hypothetical protein